MPEDLRQWVPPQRQVKDPRVRAFYFSYAGGSVRAFDGLAQAVPEGIETCCVQIPWGARSSGSSRTFSSIRDVAKSASLALAPLFDRPFVFVGYSMGALVAYELARILAVVGHDGPANLVVLSQRAPNIDALVPSLNRLPQREFVRAVDARYGGIPPVVLKEPELLDRVVPTLRAELALFEEYSWLPSTPLACNITALAGSRDRTLNRSQVAAWSEATTGIVDVTMLESGHFILAEVSGPAMRAVCRPMEDLCLRLGVSGVR